MIDWLIWLLIIKILFEFPSEILPGLYIANSAIFMGLCYI